MKLQKILMEKIEISPYKNQSPTIDPNVITIIANNNDVCHYQYD